MGDYLNQIDTLFDPLYLNNEKSFNDPIEMIMTLNREVFDIKSQLSVFFNNSKIENENKRELEQINQKLKVFQENVKIIISRSSEETRKKFSEHNILINDVRTNTSESINQQSIHLQKLENYTVSELAKASLMTNEVLNSTKVQLCIHETRILSVEEVQKAQREEINKLIDNYAEIIELKNQFAKFMKNNNHLNIKLEEIELKLSESKQNDFQEISKLNEKRKEQNIYNYENSLIGKELAITNFNAWASNPVNILPSDFFYLSNDMRIRTTQSLSSSSTETKWISNREGQVKYLFPNPNTFNQMTDISELYKMDMSRLNPKGKNKIKIINACEMSDAGYINYPGELILI